MTKKEFQRLCREGFKPYKGKSVEIGHYGDLDAITLLYDQPPTQTPIIRVIQVFHNVGTEAEIQARKARVLEKYRAWLQEFKESLRS